MTTFALPILVCLLGLIGALGTYLDSNESNQNRKYIMIVFITIISLIICGFQIKQNQENNQNTDDAQRKLDTANAELDSINKKLNDVNSQLDSTTEKLKETNSQLNTTTEKLNDANAKLETLLLAVEKPRSSTSEAAEDLLAKENRKKISIFYFKKASKIDRPELFTKLRQLETQDHGFQSVQDVECSGRDCTNSTNAIWFGSEVSDADIELVATQLISGGVAIKVIRQFYDRPEKAYFIEVGYDRAGQSCRVWQSKDIFSATIRFSRGGKGCLE
ncbi:MAG: hypothetical protein QNJ64_21445 [Crocosphaera sp.]|nr:hypothetical protein [Crocosphaera sp.]